MRNFLATLFLSQGVPMLLSGDEYGRTQGGNNNAYCQDNEISWFNWNWTYDEKKLFDFTRKMIALRKETNIFTRRKFFHGRDIHGKGMTDEEWNNSYVRCMGMLFNGEAMDEYDQKGRRIKDDVYLILVNSYWEAIRFQLPDKKKKLKWELILDTFEGGFTDKAVEGKYRVSPRSLVLLRQIQSGSKS